MQKFGTHTLLNNALNGIAQTWSTPILGAHCMFSLEAGL